MIAKWVMLLPWTDIQYASRTYKVPSELVGSIVMKESSGDKCATRYEDHYRWLYKVEEFSRMNKISKATEEIHQKTSWGLMQIMGAVAREMGFQGPLVNLCDPKINLRYGTLYLRKLIERYENRDDAIAAYNAGSPRKKGDKYVNQEYVDKVINYMAQL